MNQKDTDTSRIHLFSSSAENDIAVIRMGEDPLAHMTQIAAKENFLSHIDHLSQSSDIKIVVLLGPNADCGRSSYTSFVNDIKSKKLSINDLERMCNAINQMVLKIAGLNKLVVYANGGCILPMFLNIGLACDYRILSEDAVIQNPAAELGLIPKGGGAYLLTKMLGLTLASQILMSDDDITAAQALKWNMVNETVSPENLEPRAIEKASQLAKKPIQSLVGIKKLLHYCINDLNRCLEYETEVLRSMVRSGTLDTE